MVDTLLIVTFLVSYVVTLFAVPAWITRARATGFLAKDMNKLDKREVSELGGLCVVFGFICSLLLYIAVITFVFQINSASTQFILAALCSVLIATIIGLTDDILGWKIGFTAGYKVLLTFLIALPMVVINSGVSYMNIPWIGNLSLGILFPLIVIPIGIVGAANGFNMLAGYNGLEAGMGMIILSTLGLLSWLSGRGYVAVIAFCMVFALFAFYLFNRYPAKIFPGNILTYSVGALIAVVTVLGNIEKYALILFIPYGFEFVLKLRGSFKKESFAKPSKNGLRRPYNKYYGIEHIAIDLARIIDGKATEKGVVRLIFSMEIMLSLVVLIIFL
ncbi:glycosyl transferase family 4 [Candidatus Woesearchaeota archaeon CG08_land_8_20_14_0_20_43_7]|nr:MAG: glycosyl transferase family 4 [Candidatus Woesearchaeota archaeon CG08_land_8_20_14_0_20_43_7]